MGLSRTISEIDVDFSRKSQKNPTPRILRPRWRGSPWNWVPALGVKKTRMMGLLPGRQRSLTTSSAVWIECTNVTDRRTNGRTNTGRQQRPRLRIAPRSKNHYAARISRTYNISPPLHCAQCLSSRLLHRQILHCGRFKLKAWNALPSRLRTLVCKAYSVEILKLTF